MSVEDVVKEEAEVESDDDMPVCDLKFTILISVIIFTLMIFLYSLEAGGC